MDNSRRTLDTTMTKDLYAIAREYLPGRELDLSLARSVLTSLQRTTATENESKMVASTVPCERSGSMKRSRFSEEQIDYAIRQAESGTSIGDLCRQLGVSEATFYTWK